MSAIDTLRVALFGNPPSPSHEPSQAGVFSAFGELRQELLAQFADVALSGVVGVVKTTRAALEADLAHGPDTVGFVYADATPSNNDLYIKSGATGAGGWTLTGMFNDVFENVAARVDSVYSDGALNLGVGDSVGGAITSGTNNTLFGPLAGRDLSSGSHNVLIGWGASYLASAITDSVIVGSGAGTSLTGGKSAIVAIGRGAAAAFNASEMTAVGSFALNQATGLGNTALGVSAGSAITTGTRNIFVGYSATGDSGLSDAIVIGYAATGNRNSEIMIGTGVQKYLSMFGISFARWEATGSNLWLGDDGPSLDPSGINNLGIGRAALNTVTVGEANLAIGSGAMELQLSGKNNVALGVAAGQFSEALFDSTVVGVSAGRYMLGGVGATLCGFRALEHCNEALNNTAVGDSALWHIQGSGNTGIGYTVAEGLETGDDNVFGGNSAARYRKNASDSVFIGVLSGALTSYASVTNVVTAAPGASLGTRPASGVRIVAVGKQSLEECLGSDVVAIGHRAGRSLVATSGVSLLSTFVGPNAGNNASQKHDAVNSTAIGANSFTDRDNQVVLGDSSVVETILRGVLRGATFTVSSLPSAATMGAGARAFVTDASATTFTSVVAGGGSNSVPVYSDGSNWRVG